VRDLILAALLEGPAHGYQIMDRLESATDGRWRPSPGSVYPTLQMLEDQGLALSRDDGGRKVFELTDAGREQADSSAIARLSERTDGNDTHRQLRDQVMRLMDAARQIGMSGDDALMSQALVIVKDARQALYRLLAEE
ncbi:MAG: helix-turn-helix transcriptional regulator, partial [Acidimicrobiaceae bacterium]|nr:helix-turn-helix transcriptional regulator [Acidimicrobiaceae bacterium]